MMAAGSSYPATFTDASGLERFDGRINYTDASSQPLPATLPAAVNAAALPTSNPGPGLLWSNSGVVTVGT